MLIIFKLFFLIIFFLKYFFYFQLYFNFINYKLNRNNNIMDEKEKCFNTNEKVVRNLRFNKIEKNRMV